MRERKTQEEKPFENEQGLTVKQMNFCLKYVEIGNATEAYKQSYDVKTNKRDSMKSMAVILMKNEKVRDYIAVLQAKNITKHGVTMEFMLEEYLAVKNMASLLEQPQHMKGALDSIMKLYGLGKENHDVKGDLLSQVPVMNLTFQKPKE